MKNLLIALLSLAFAGIIHAQTATNLDITPAAPIQVVAPVNVASFKLVQIIYDIPTKTYTARVLGSDGKMYSRSIQNGTSLQFIKDELQSHGSQLQAYLIANPPTPE